LPGDGAPEKPVKAKATKIPLLSVTFRLPVELPGCHARTRLLECGCMVLGNDGQKCPQIWLDTEHRVVDVGGAWYPFDGALVERVVRAKAAIG
jgi:hypothetical protein